MEDLVLSCLESRVEDSRNLYARFLVGPFLKGDALTIATALRRVLLSSIEVIGITALYIQGITHEFSTIVGVRESVLELSLNFGAIVLSYDKTFFQKKGFFDNLQIGYLQIQGPKVVYANNLKLPLGVKLVDPTQYIATVSKEGSIVLKFIIGKRNNSLQQNIGSESHFGDKSKDLSIVGEIGKKNITRAKKKCSYKDGFTIKSSLGRKPDFCFAKVRNYFWMQPQSGVFRTLGRRQSELGFGLPLSPESAHLSQGVLQSFALQEKLLLLQSKSTQNYLQIFLQSEALHLFGFTKQNRIFAKQKQLQAEHLKNKPFDIFFRKSCRQSLPKHCFCVQSFALQAKIRKAVQSFAKRNLFVQNKLPFCTKRLHATRRDTNRGLQNRFFFGTQHTIKRFNPLLSNPFRAKFGSTKVKSTTYIPFPLKKEVAPGGRKLCFSYFFPCVQNPANLWPPFPKCRGCFWKGLQDNSKVVATNKQRNRWCCKQHGNSYPSDKVMKRFACQENQRRKGNGKTVRCKSGFLKGTLAFLNKQGEKERNRKRNQIKQRKLKFLSSNNVFKSNICLRNVIPLDLSLNPILKVNFVVEIDDEVLYLRQKIRERIILEVWTNGSVHPRQAVHDSSLRLLDMFASFRSVYQVVAA